MRGSEPPVCKKQKSAIIDSLHFCKIQCWEPTLLVSGYSRRSQSSDRNLLFKFIQKLLVNENKKLFSPLFSWDRFETYLSMGLSPKSSSNNFWSASSRSSSFTICQRMVTFKLFVIQIYSISVKISSRAWCTVRYNLWLFWQDYFDH